MKEQGVVIYPDGEVITFGKHVHMDEVNYLASPTHQDSFIEEIVKSFKFKLLELDYNFDNSVYKNAINLSLNGLIIIFNNTETTKTETSSLCYVPLNPTEEQKLQLEENGYSLIFDVNRIYEFNTDDFDDYQEYSSFDRYLENKNIKK